ncbi:hypothetical protein BK765_06175 [Bacillus thuringiensis serovar dakota]|nr:hypothetical protein BK765_06175 [Bacillus thuringiensis serovar dakota]
MSYLPIQFFIHPYYSAVLGFLFVTESVKKLYKIVYNLNVEVFKNTGGILLIIKQKVSIEIYNLIYLKFNILRFKLVLYLD